MKTVITNTNVVHLGESAKRVDSEQQAPQTELRCEYRLLLKLTRVGDPWGRLPDVAALQTQAAPALVAVETVKRVHPTALLAEPTLDANDVHFEGRPMARAYAHRPAALAFRNICAAAGYPASTEAASSTCKQYVRGRACQQHRHVEVVHK